MASLRTRIVLRNDTTANWLVAQSVVLLKGEVGIEFLADGKVKMKIGDGIKTWAELDYFGGAYDEVEIALQALETELTTVKAQIGTVVEGKTIVDMIEESIYDDSAIRAHIATIEEDYLKESDKLSLIEEIGKKANAEDVYTKDEVNGIVSGVYHYRGTKATYAELPTEGQVIGDVWNIETADITYGILPGDNVVWNGSSWDKLAGVVDLSGYVTVGQFAPVKEAVEQIPEKYLTKKQANATLERVKYEITSTPEGTLVDYRDKEIRVMCPADAKFTKQAVGTGGDANTYYMTFKTYVPNDDVVGYVEHLNGQVDSEILTDLKTDVYGRRYQPTWLGLAKYDETTDTWAYYGKNSFGSKYIGWDYQIDWYNADGKIIDSYSVRINLSNETCHNNLEPYYMDKVVKGVKVNGTLLDLVNNEINIEVPIIKSSDGENKIAVAEDGTMEVNSVNVNKLVQTDGEYLVLNGGSSAI